MQFDVLTLFPDLFDNFKQESLIQRAIKNEILDIETIDFRGYTDDRHHKVDDYPFGGGSGMLLMAEPIFLAHEDILSRRTAARTHTVYMSPAGKTLTQSRAQQLAAEHDHLIILCGRYEGVDQRVIDALVDEEISIGDYVLFGGELPAMVLIEAVSRHVEGVLGNRSSLDSESFHDDLLEYPQYTKPRSFRGMDVPEVLLSGNHQAIDRWKREQALSRTEQRRPDLIEKREEPRKEGHHGHHSNDRE